MPEDDDRQARVALLLEDNIRTEIQAQDAGAHLGLSPEAITRLAWGRSPPSGGRLSVLGRG